MKAPATKPDDLGFIGVRTKSYKLSPDPHTHTPQKTHARHKHTREISNVKVLRKETSILPILSNYLPRKHSKLVPHNIRTADEEPSRHMMNTDEKI